MIPLDTPDDTPDTVAARLRHALAVRGLPAHRASERAGLSRAAARWILEHPEHVEQGSGPRGERVVGSPSCATVAALARALDVSPAWLAFGAPYAPPEQLQRPGDLIPPPAGDLIPPPAAVVVHSHDTPAAVVVHSHDNGPAEFPSVTPAPDAGTQLRLPSAELLPAAAPATAPAPRRPVSPAVADQTNAPADVVEQLRARLRAAGWTQGRIARTSGVSQGVVSEFLAGKYPTTRAVTVARLTAAADALDLEAPPAGRR